MAAALVTDLVVTIALYTPPSITNDVLTISVSTAPYAYRAYTWWQKLTIIRKGVVTDTVPIDTYFDWYYTYRQLNSVEYGTASHLQSATFEYRFDSKPLASPQFQLGTIPDGAREWRSVFSANI